MLLVHLFVAAQSARLQTWLACAPGRPDNLFAVRQVSLFPIVNDALILFGDVRGGVSFGEFLVTQGLHSLAGRAVVFTVLVVKLDRLSYLANPPSRFSFW